MYSLFVRRKFYICRLFYHYFFLISPSSGAPRRLYFVIVAFPRYLHLHASANIYSEHVPICQKGDCFHLQILLNYYFSAYIGSTLFRE